MTVAQKPRKTAAAPRRAARSRAKTNGQKVAPADVRPPERFDTAPIAPVPAPEVKPPEIKVPEHPYGDKPVYVFHPMQVQPGDSMDPIVFPAISTLNADVEFFWELDEMDPMHQAFRYMKKAQVPRDIQRRVVRLPEKEMSRFLNGWFMGVLMPQGVRPPGES